MSVEDHTREYVIFACVTIQPTHNVEDYCSTRSNGCQIC